MSAYMDVTGEGEGKMPGPNGQLKNRREPLYLEDDLSIDLDYFYVPAHYNESLDRILVSHGAIVDRVEKLAYDIVQDYHGHTIHLLCVLKGGSTFFQDLSNALRKFHDYARNDYIPFTFDFVRAKSYEGTDTTGNVKITGCDVSKFAGRHILLVEDIIDTGTTMKRLLPYLMDQVEPASIRVASLVEKRTDRASGFKADYVGFSIPDKFVVGYCLDYNEAYRDLQHIAVVNDVGIEKYKSYDS